MRIVWRFFQAIIARYLWLYRIFRIFTQMFTLAMIFHFCHGFYFYILFCRLVLSKRELNYLRTTPNAKIVEQLHHAQYSQLICIRRKKNAENTQHKKTNKQQKLHHPRTVGKPMRRWWQNNKNNRSMQKKISNI